MTEAERYILGGRAFVQIGESTVEHDLAVREAVCKAGLDHLDMMEGEAPEEYARRLLRHVTASGKTLPLLGLLLIPEGLASDGWTPEVAAETVAHIKRLPAAEVLPKLDGIVVGVLIGFFDSGLASLWRSATSSSPGTGLGGESEQKDAQAGMGNGPA